MDNSKTYKREVSVVMLLFLAGLSLAGIIWPDSQSWQAAEFFTFPIFTFAGGAFGLDAYFKRDRQ